MYTEKLIKQIAEKTGIDISKFDMNELVMGMDVELEHGSSNEKTDVTDDDPIKTFKIVMAHMYEMPDYYTNLKKMEKSINESKINDVNSFEDEIDEGATILAALGAGWYATYNLDIPSNWLNQIHGAKMYKRLGDWDMGQIDDRNIESLKDYYNRSASHFGLDKEPYGDMKADAMGILKAVKKNIPSYPASEIQAAFEKNPNITRIFKSVIGGTENDARRAIIDTYGVHEVKQNLEPQEMNENNNITAYAKRMRELAGLSEGNQTKTLKTIQEGTSSFEGGQTFYAKDMMGESSKNEALENPDKADLDKDGKISDYEEKRGKAIDKNMKSESEEKGDDFETHKFEQKTIEEGADDEELYNLNENTIIVLDFIEDKDAK